MNSARVALLAAVLSSFGCSEFMQRNEAAGLRIARHNYRFAKAHPEADGLLNAAAYARALLYEALLNRPHDRDGIEGALFAKALARVTDPPSSKPAEEILMSGFVRRYWPVFNSAEWTQAFHQQLCDILSTDELEDAAGEIESSIDYYLREPMALSDRRRTPGEPASFDGELHRRFPRWARLLHELGLFQVALLEALSTAASPSERTAKVHDAIFHLRAQVHRTTLDKAPPPPLRFAEVAPRFSALHPRAETIFDNLERLHDGVADVLAAAPRRDEDRQITALFEQLRATRSTMAQRR